uniref:Peptidase S74 domain-containing protein n=1 Tax=Chromera velia CCMP2878 TaxID=1169474 RepID=A0A0G4HPX2_9ALVE|eukprot:Cvel_7850.t1-p1 / transcript=Cvel_7850.t1 / gene=Cvel_7850 / organism=Chromera_velia_CCMP2878 / gene_product=hypothetical protein / transcript_product=hypothetical protein / location=Cvel_scaffold420:30192-33899(+) / protein_length=610 / sequence_SO=supercontig / SO=protein_coding / is_pseudo=false
MTKRLVFLSLTLAGSLPHSARGDKEPVFNFEGMFEDFKLNVQKPLEGMAKVPGLDKLAGVKEERYEEKKEAANEKRLDIVADRDADPNNEKQTLKVAGVAGDPTRLLTLSHDTNAPDVLNIEDGDADDTNEIQSLTVSGSSGAATRTLSLSDDPSGDDTLNVEDADSSTSNEIQSLSVTGVAGDATRTFTLSSDPSGADVVNIEDDDADPTNELITAFSFDSSSSTLSVTEGDTTSTADFSACCGGGGGGSTCSTFNTNSGFGSLACGGLGNVACQDGSAYCWVGGGQNNIAQTNKATIAGGEGNQAAGFAFVGGGQNNIGTVFGAVIAGGIGNSCPSGTYCAIGGGLSNQASDKATVGGGESNQATAFGSTVGGGFQNIASGDSATVPGGRDNTASGPFSVAMGRSATANMQSSFIFSDNDPYDVGGTWGTSTSMNSFEIYASDLVAFNLRTGRCIIDGGDAATGLQCTASSDKNRKELLGEPEGKQLLDTLDALEVHRFRYKRPEDNLRGTSETDRQRARALHIGPTAQDFAAAFGFGAATAEGKEATTVSPADLASVGLVGVKELNRQLGDLRKTVADQAKEIEALKEGFALLSAQLKQGGVKTYVA